MAWECIIPGKEIVDVKADKKGSKRVEQYLVRNGKAATLGYQPDAWKEWK